MKSFVLILMFTSEFLIRLNFIIEVSWTIQKHSGLDDFSRFCQFFSGPFGTEETL